MASDNLDKIYILFVDDEIEFRDNFTYSIEIDAVEVLTAKSVDAALEILEKDADKIAVLVTDFYMPIQTGVDLLKIVVKRWPHITRMLCTAYKDLEVAKSAVNAGHIHAYFNKPWDIDELNQNILEGIAVYQENKINYQLKNINDSLKDEDSFKELLFQSNHDQVSDFCNTVSSVTSHLLHEEKDQEKISLLQMAEVASKVSAFRVNNLLDYCLIRNKHFNLQKTPIMLHELAETLKEDYRILFEEFGGSFKIQLDEGSLSNTIVTDKDRLYRIISGMINYCSAINGEHHLLLEVRYSCDIEKQHWLLIEVSCPTISITKITKNIHALSSDKKSILEDNKGLAGSELDLFMSNELAKQMYSEISFKVDSKGKIIFSCLMNVEVLH